MFPVLVTTDATKALNPSRPRPLSVGGEGVQTISQTQRRRNAKTRPASWTEIKKSLKKWKIPIMMKPEL